MQQPPQTSSDTIAAIATAPGRGAVGVVRISGPRAAAVAERLCGPLPPPRTAALRALRDAGGEIVDRGLVLHFPAPNSFTGEDVVELQAHGGTVLLDLLLQAACAAGARPARAGEFSERAFLNGRIDLAQAEAIADLIDAASAEAARAARRSLDGEFSQRVTALAEQLTALRADLEAALDFADEDDVPWLDAQTLRQRIEAVAGALRSLLARAGQGRRLREGMVVAIAGRPNVGKSTLLNRLAGADVAIVSPIAGTTRDLLREVVIIDGMPLTLVDTAGLRESGDPVEREGIARARRVLADAEVALFVVDDREGIGAEDRALLATLPPAAPRIVLRNKCDLSGAAPGPCDDDARSIRLSAATGAGVDDLRRALREAAGLAGTPQEGVFSARRRHLEALRGAQQHVDSALQPQSLQRFELLAEELRLAQQALEELTGRVTSEDLLGRIFSSFCIGK
jgi:tRNA modification GTPase